MISFVGCRTLWIASREISFLPPVCDNDAGWLLLIGGRLLSQIRYSIIAISLYLLCSLGRWWNVGCVSFDQTVISSSWDLFSPFWHAVAAVPNTNTDDFTLSWDNGSFESICSGGVVDLVFLGSVHPLHCTTLL